MAARGGRRTAPRRPRGRPAPPSVGQRVRRASARTWTVVLAPAVTVLVAAFANGWLVPLVKPSPSAPQAAAILGVRLDSHGELATVLSAAERADPRFSRVLRCDVAVYAVRLRASGFTHDDPPRLRWTLVDENTKRAWPVPQVLAVLRNYVVSPSGGSQMIWIPVPDESADWVVRVDAFDARRGPDHPFDSRRGDQLIHSEVSPPGAGHCPS